MAEVLYYAIPYFLVLLAAEYLAFRHLGGSYYWFHRVSHESRVFWASHVVHHSSQHYNLSTALRQTWVPMTYFPVTGSTTGSMSSTWTATTAAS